ncbi:hypothetical protein IT774_04180 [Salinimonas marina]|uniref:Glycosyltransferase family 8 protein n=1 Tax=Salinimonas marina TaxID=2785918 RepID=A0A7S9HDL6_9ALTE|nr:glycosyltransferase [Salinimonas marina]QPG06396.1 hypothetical protein IT774_04180 [Salinimonas marina]
MDNEKRLVVTIVIGEEIGSLAKYTVPTMEAYAKKVGADFKQLGKTEISDKYLEPYEKNQIRKFFDKYDKVLFIDADILVTPDAADFFDACEGDNMGMVSVDKYYPVAEREKKNLQKVLGEVDWKKDYFNAGVMLYTSKYQHVLNTDDGLIDKWRAAQAKGMDGRNDQSIFNYRVNKHDIPTTFVDRGFNFTRVFGCFEKRFSQYFIHYAGLKGNRLTRIKVDNYVMNTPLLYKILKKCPKVTWVFDRVILRIL